MKDVANFEVVALYDENRIGKSGFVDTLAGGEAGVLKSLMLRPELFQPGTRVIVQVAECPTCGLATTNHVEGICPCGHDWIAWCQVRYAEYAETDDDEQQQADAGSD